MSNIAGKAYGFNVITPTRFNGVWNRAVFFLTRRFLSSKLRGLATLSLIHYARWVMIRPKDFPYLGAGQPREEVKSTYEFFFSNFNGSWNQYIDSFSMSIPTGLDLLWGTNVNYPKSVPIEDFHRYINANQIPTAHYYSAYPLASSNDVKSAARVRASLLDIAKVAESGSDEDFINRYNTMLIHLQHDLSLMEKSPIVSLANEAVEERDRIQLIDGYTG